MFCMKNREREEIRTYHFRFPKHRFDSYRSVLKKEFKTKKCNYYISFFLSLECNSHSQNMCKYFETRTGKYNNELDISVYLWKISIMLRTLNLHKIIGIQYGEGSAWIIIKTQSFGRVKLIKHLVNDFIFICNFY